MTEIERHYIGSVDLVTTVSKGIASALQRDYNLAAAPIVIRNLPRFRSVIPRPANSRRQVLFHGLIRPERGLDELIESARAWTFDGEIVLRGYGSLTYLELLRARARAVRPDLLVVEGPVKPDELIRRASFSDIGFLALPAVTPHYEFALPNKLFEYWMAGLPVLATPRHEIRQLIEETGAGFLTELSPQAIARSLNAISPEQLAAKSRAALAAATSLNWEAEGANLIAALEPLIAQAQPRPSA